MTDIRQDMTVLDRLKTEMVRVFQGASDEAYIAQLFADAAQEIRAQEARIAALSKDAERLKFFNQAWRWKALKDGEIIYQYGEHVPSLFQKTAELLPTHQPAPKAITADMVTDEMVKTSVFVNVFNAKQQIANVVNAFNGVNP